MYFFQRENDVEVENGAATTCAPDVIETLYRKLDDQTAVAVHLMHDGAAEHPGLDQDPVFPAFMSFSQQKAGEDQVQNLAKKLLLTHIDTTLGHYQRPGRYEQMEARDAVEYMDDHERTVYFTQLAKALEEEAEPEELLNMAQRPELIRPAIDPNDVASAALKDRRFLEWADKHRPAYAVDDADWLRRKALRAYRLGELDEFAFVRELWAGKVRDTFTWRDILVLLREDSDWVENCLDESNAERLVEDVWDGIWSRIAEERATDIVFIGFRDHGGGDYSLTPVTGIPERIEGACLPNEDGREMLDAAQQGYVFGSIGRSRWNTQRPKGKAWRVTVDPEFHDLLGITAAFFETKAQAMEWMEMRSKGLAFTPTQHGLAIGRRRLLEAIAEDQIAQLEDWLNGRVYTLHAAQLIYDGEIEAWVETGATTVTIGNLYEGDIDCVLDDVLAEAHAEFTETPAVKAA